MEVPDYEHRMQHLAHSVMLRHSNVIYHYLSCDITSALAVNLFHDTISYGNE